MSEGIVEIESKILSSADPFRCAISLIKEKIKELEGYTGSYWVVYWADVDNHYAGDGNLIINEDLEIFRDMLRDVKGGTLFLDITSPGGKVDAAEAIISYLTSKFKSIKIVVPHIAKSASTLLCLLAREIYMGDYSFIGPISPLVGKENEDAVHKIEEFRYIESLFKKTAFELSKIVSEKLPEKIKKDTQGPNGLENNLDNIISENIANNKESIEQFSELFSNLMASIYMPILKMEYPLYEAEEALRIIREVGLKAFKWSNRFNKVINDEELTKIIDNLLRKDDRPIRHTKYISKKEAKIIGLNIIDLEDHKNVENNVIYIQNVLRVLNSNYNIIKFVIAGNGQFRFTIEKKIGFNDSINKNFTGNINHLKAQEFINYAHTSIDKTFSRFLPSISSRLAEKSSINDKITDVNKIQLQKMIELWDNEYDDIWDDL